MLLIDVIRLVQDWLYLEITWTDTGFTDTQSIKHILKYILVEDF